jgi:hypothetical protein
VDYPCLGKVDTSGKGDEVGKGCERMNMVQTLCTHACKKKKDVCETVSSIGQIKENGGRDEFKYDIFNIL